MVGPEGVGLSSKIKQLACQTSPNRFIEFQGELPELSNQNDPLLELLGFGRSPSKKENAAPVTAGNGVEGVQDWIIERTTTPEPASIPASSALDLPLAISRFPNVKAGQVERSTVSLRQIAELIEGTRAKAKADLPLLKLGTFGDLRTDRGSLRHDANLQAVSGVEGDYDAGQVSPADAAERLRKAGIAGLIYTTPSHTKAAPRWRVLCPLAATASPAERDELCARVNWALGGILAPESFTRSQTYYAGAIEGQPAPVVHLVDGRALDMATDLPSIGRASATAEMEAADLEPISDSDAFDTAPDWARIKSALRSIKDASDRQTWLEIGQALHHASQSDPAEGFRLWCVWSKRCPEKYSDKAQLRAWRSFGTDRRGPVLRIGTLFHYAKAAGWTGDVAPAAPSRLAFLSPADCEAAPSRGYIIKGFVAPGDVGCIFGAPGAGKSLLAPFLGYMVAQGSPAFGMRTRKGGVWYVAAEDPHGMRGRVKALKIANGDAPGFTLIEGVSDLLRDDSADLVALEAAVKERAPALIFIDTLAMAFPGLEENSAEAMGRVVAVARRLAEGGAAVVLIHHDTKAEGATPRGHSLLNGAVDVALHVKRDEENGVIRGKLTKNRNGTCERDIAFVISTEDGGTDEDGDKITLPRCCPVDAPKGERQKRLSPSAVAALDVLRGLGQPTEDEWRQACLDGRTVSASEEIKSRQTAFRRAVADLTRSGTVIFDGVRYAEDDGFDAICDFVSGDRQRQTGDMSPLVANGKAAEPATDSDIYPLGYVALSPPMPKGLEGLI